MATGFRVDLFRVDALTGSDAAPNLPPAAPGKTNQHYPPPGNTWGTGGTADGGGGTEEHGDMKGDTHR